MKVRGAKLVTLRDAAGLRAKDVAEACGVTPQSVSRWEDGDNILPKYHRPLAEVLGVDIEVIASMYDPLDVSRSELAELTAKVDRLTALVERMISET